MALDTSDALLCRFEAPRGKRETALSFEAAISFRIEVADEIEVARRPISSALLISLLGVGVAGSRNAETDNCEG